MYFTVTKEWLEDNKTCRGGYTTVQIKALGWEKGLKTKNWKRRSIGLVLTLEQKSLFESLSESSISKTKGRKLAKALIVNSKKQTVVSTAEMRRLEETSFNPDWTKEFIASSEFLKTFQWCRVRMKALKKYGNTCMCCGATREDGVKICVDHIKPRKLFPKLALDVNNLQILCDVCNLGKGNGFDIDWKSGYTAPDPHTDGVEIRHTNNPLSTESFAGLDAHSLIVSCRSQSVDLSPW